MASKPSRNASKEHNAKRRGYGTKQTGDASAHHTAEEDGVCPACKTHLQRLQETNVELLNGLNHQRGLIKTLVEQLKTSGQQEWIDNLPKLSVQESREEDDSVVEFEGSDDTFEGSKDLHMNSQSAPFIWDGEKEELIPLTIEGREFKAMILTSAFIDHFNELLNCNIIIHRYKQQKKEEQEEIKYYTERLDAFKATVEAGRPVNEAEGLRAVEFAEASINFDKKLDAFIGVEEDRRAKAARAVTRELRNVFRGTELRQREDDSWFQQFVEEKKNKYGPGIINTPDYKDFQRPDDLEPGVVSETDDDDEEEVPAMSQSISTGKGSSTPGSTMSKRAAQPVTPGSAGSGGSKLQQVNESGEVEGEAEEIVTN